MRASKSLPPALACLSARLIALPQLSLATHAITILVNQLHAHFLRSYLPSPALLSFFNLSIRSLSKPKPSLSVRLFLLLTRLSLRPDSFTLPFSLLSSSSLPFLSSLHSLSLRLGLFPFSLPTSNALLHSYARLNSLYLARQVFHEIPCPDLVSFNSLLCAYARLGTCRDFTFAISFFDKMPQKNVISWNAMIAGYVNCHDLASAQQVFEQMPVRNSVSWSVLIDGYCRAQMVDHARELFDRMPERSVEAWTVVMNGYSHCGRPKEAIELFHEMEQLGLEPDAAAMISVATAAAQMGSAEFASWVGSYVDQKGIKRSERLLTSLVDMHAKCGNVDAALECFKEIKYPDVFPYTALINGLASHGHALKALRVFDTMQSEAIPPHPITFIGILSACVHAGLVEKGLEFWESMVRDHQMVRGPDHYACVVDLLGRAGRLHEALDMVQKMPWGPHGGALGALLSACKTYNNVEIAESVVSELFELEPNNRGNYILLSSIYAERGQWEEASRVRKTMREKMESKHRACSWI